MSSKQPPIYDALSLLKEIKVELETIKNEVSHIKNYIRKEEIRKQIELEKEQQLAEKESEYVKTGWW